MFKKSLYTIAINVFLFSLVLTPAVPVNADTGDVPISVTVQPADATGLTATGTTNGTGACDLVWTTSITPNVDTQRLEIDGPQAPGVSFTTQNLAFPGAGIGDSITISNLVIDYSYLFRLVSIAGTLESNGIWAPLPCTPTSDLDPPYLAAETATTVGTSNTLTFTSGDDDAENCNISASIANLNLDPLGLIVDESGWQPCVNAPQDYTFNGLTPGMTYYYHVQSQNIPSGLNYSPFSNVVFSTQVTAPDDDDDDDPPPPVAGGGGGGGGGDQGDDDDDQGQDDGGDDDDQGQDEEEEETEEEEVHEAAPEEEVGEEETTTEEDGEEEEEEEEAATEEEAAAEEEAAEQAAQEQVIPSEVEGLPAGQQTVAYRGGTPGSGTTRIETLQEIIKTFELYENYAGIDKPCMEDLNNCMLPFRLHSHYKNLDLKAQRYYPDVFLIGEKAATSPIISKVFPIRTALAASSAYVPVLSDDLGVTKSQRDAIHFATRIGMVHGFYTDIENQSPFGPHWDVSRIEYLKMLEWATGINKQWIYSDEYFAMLGGPENVSKQRVQASDLNPTVDAGWWFPRYHNAACDLKIISCSPDVKFKPYDVATPTWKRDMLARFTLYYQQQETDDFADDDMDGLINKDERFILLTDVNNDDTDDDALDDGEEVNIYKTNPNKNDSDGDNLDDGEEINTYHTDPLKPDTDDDGFTDSIEIELGTDPNNQNEFPTDVNQNGIDDAWEISYGISSMSGSDDFDNDGLSNLMEYRYGTDPTKVDTDGDGLSDADEVLLYGTDPLVPTNLEETGIRITNIKDGMILTDLRPFIQGFAPIENIEVEIILRNEFGHEIVLGKTVVDENKAFVFETPFDLLDGDFYLLAKGLDPQNKRVIESPLIHVTLDSTLQVQLPTPERLANVTISDKVILEDVRIIIKDNKPLLIGRTGYKNRVVATWQSVIGTSAVVADLASGEFHLEAPRELEYGEHTVSIQSIRETDQAVSKLVTVKFEVKEPLMSMLHGVAIGEEIVFPWYVWLIIFTICIGFIGGGFWLKRQKK